MRNTAMLLLAAVLLAAALPAGVAQEDGEKNLASEIFNFPEDHRLKNNAPIANEYFSGWHYFTGTLTGDDGNLYGFQFTLFEPKMAGVIMYTTHVAISDVNESRHPFYEYVPLANGDVPKITEGADGEPYWRYQDTRTTFTYWEESDRWTVVTEGPTSEDAHGEHIGLNLTMVNDKADYYAERGDGIGTMGDCTEQDRDTILGYSYYYSHPEMTTTGTLTIDGEDIAVSGDSWFDHQWGNYGNCHVGWDWWGMSLDDGSHMMIFNFKNKEGDNLGIGGVSYFSPEGKSQWWSEQEGLTLTPTRWWRSDRFGIRYPIEWIIATPAGTFAIEPYFDEQTMALPSLVKYWEGLVRVREGSHAGPQIGTAYMELANYPEEE